MCYKRCESLRSSDSAVGEPAEVTADHRAGFQCRLWHKQVVTVDDFFQTSELSNRHTPFPFHSFLGRLKWNRGFDGSLKCLCRCRSVSTGVKLPRFKPGPHYLLAGEPGASHLTSHVHNGDDNDCDENNNNELLSPRTIRRSGIFLSSN